MSHILIVDDEESNLRVLEHSLEKESFTLYFASGGEQALNILSENPHIELVMLDRKMPEVSGMDVLNSMKQNELLRHIPVVMQTAAANKDEVLEGIEAGVYYYLTKPYSMELMQSIVYAALSDTYDITHASDEYDEYHHAFGMMQNAKFYFRTMDEARILSSLVSHCFPDPERVTQGIAELAYNAIEHGNLNISYPEKKALMIEGRLDEEILYRLSMPEYRERAATMTVEIRNRETVLSITDKGNGFDYQNFMEIDPERLTDPNGRGISLFVPAAFDKIQYVGKGNKIVCRVEH